MLIISNHAQNIIDLPNHTIIRINMAWIINLAQLEQILENNCNKDIFLDLPTGRTKPPQPMLGLQHAMYVMKKYINIKYFAVSNAEDSSELAIFYSIIPNTVKIVPKIESQAGVINLLGIVNVLKTDIVMLDKEDLYMSVNKDSVCFNKLVNIMRKTCRDNNIKLLELKGVIFSDG